MRLFAIDKDETITAFPAAEQVPEGQEQFASEKELAKLAANWPADRLAANLEQLRRRRRIRRRSEAGQEVHRPQERRGPDLEGHPETGRPRAPHTAADVAPKAKRSKKACHDQGRRARGARGQQEGHRAGAAPPQGRRDAGRDRQSDRLADTTASGASSAVRSPRRWVSRSSPARTRPASAAITLPANLPQQHRAANLRIGGVGLLPPPGIAIPPTSPTASGTGPRCPGGRIEGAASRFRSPRGNGPRHAAGGWRSPAISRKVLPSLSSVASWPA